MSVTLVPKQQGLEKASFPLHGRSHRLQSHCKKRNYLLNNNQVSVQGARESNKLASKAQEESSRAERMSNSKVMNWRDTNSSEGNMV